MKKSELTIKCGDKGQKIMKKISVVPIGSRRNKKEILYKGPGKLDKERIRKRIKQTDFGTSLLIKRKRKKERRTKRMLLSGKRERGAANNIV